MSTASTEPPPAKRVRISPDNPSILKPGSYSTSKNNTGTDSTLPPAIKSLSTYYAEKYMKIAKKIEAKMSVIHKFSDNTYIPKSARLNFKLGVPDFASTSEKYDALAASAIENREKYEKSQKKIILEAAQLELDLLIGEKQKIFCEALYKLASIFYLANSNASGVNEALVHKIALNIIVYNNNIASHSFVGENLQKFRSFYYEMFPESQPANDKNNNDEYNTSDVVLTQLANDSSIAKYFQTAPAENTSTTTTVVTNTTTDSNTPLATTNDSIATNTYTPEVVNVDAEMDLDDSTIGSTTTNMPLTNEVLQQMSALLMQMFVYNWNSYKADLDSKLLNARLSKFATTTMQHQATNKAAELLANEASATPQQISELIDKAVDKKTGKLAKELATLKQKMARGGNNNNNNHINNSSNTTNIIKNKNNNSNKNNDKRKQPTRSNHNNTNDNNNNHAKNNNGGEKKTRAQTPKKPKITPQPTVQRKANQNNQQNATPNTRSRSKALKRRAGGAANVSSSNKQKIMRTTAIRVSERR